MPGGGLGGNPMPEGGIPGIPGGGIPGIPGGGIPGIPGGGTPGIPGGGIPDIPGGGMPGIPGGPRGANWDMGGACIIPAEGPPTPLTGPLRPAWGAPVAGCTGRPLPTAFPAPGPPGVNFSFSSGGGGPSIVIDTTESPRNIIKPKFLFSSFCSVIPCPFFDFNILYSSASPNTKFI